MVSDLFLPKAAYSDVKAKPVFQRVLLHASFWMIFLIYITIDVLEGEEHLSHVLIVNCFYLISTMAGVYINLYIVVPSFLYKGKISLYIFSFLLLLLLTSGLKVYFIESLVGSTEIAERGVIRTYITWFIQDIFEISAISSIKIARDWIKTSNKLNQKEKQQLEAEYKFLKAQINPHFIFNTLNNIYFLILMNNPKSAEAVLSLSNLLRYRIYDFDDKENVIENEILCIKELIQLEKLRNDDQVKIDFDVEGNFEKHKIEPLLFIPFIENAFKHCSASGSLKLIDIRFKLEPDEVHFYCSNSKTDSSAYYPSLSDKNCKGVGIKNTKNRLQLYYPDKHLLVIDDKADTYTVELSIRLK